jgi:hypothetical protein
MCILCRFANPFKEALNVENHTEKGSSLKVEILFLNLKSIHIFAAH